jgi:hypothetical protein
MQDVPNASIANAAAAGHDHEAEALSRPNLLSHIKAATARARHASDAAYRSADDPHVTFNFMIGVLIVNMCGIAALFALPRRAKAWSGAPELHYLDILHQTAAVCFFLASLFDALVFSFLGARLDSKRDRRGCVVP